MRVVSIHNSDTFMIIYNSQLKGKEMYKLSIHFACGMGTYIFKDGDKVTPITRFIDVRGMFTVVC